MNERSKEGDSVTLSTGNTTTFKVTALDGHGNAWIQEMEDDCGFVVRTVRLNKFEPEKMQYLNTYSWGAGATHPTKESALNARGRDVLGTIAINHTKKTAEWVA